MKEILKTYLRRLTNLTGNNRSLLLLRLLNDQFIDIHSFNRLKKLPSFSIIEALIEKKQFLLCDEMDPRDEHVNKVSRQLKRLKRRENYIYEEKGTRDLYIGWPFVRGQFADGTLVRCPLLFFPVKVELIKGRWILFPDQSIDISFNKTFLLAYSHFNEISLDENFMEKSFEDYDKESMIFRTALYQELKESAIDVNFNQQNFGNELFSFENFTKKDLQEKTAAGELKLYPEAALGIFPQGGSNLAPDYQWLIEKDHIRSLEEMFSERNPGEAEPSMNFINKIKEEKTFAPFALDAYQENALKGIKSGNSLVVQGPPGTGKSQLICNLICDAIANNKKVLVVCQKRVALDVVFRRLEDQEMGDFIALVHDYKNDRKNIFSKIASQTDKIEEYQLQNRSLDSIQLERNFLKTSRNIDQLTEELEEFREALYNEKECGLSVKELYLTSSLEKPSLNLRLEYRNFHFNEVSDFTKRLNLYAKYHQQFSNSGHLLSRRKSFVSHTITDLQTMKALIDDIFKFRKKFDSGTYEIIGSTLSFEDALALIRRRHFIVEMLGILDRPQAYEWFQHLLNHSDKETDNLWLSNVERVIMDCYKGQEPEITLTTAEIGPFQETLQKKLDARSNLFKLLKWTLFERAAVARVNEVLKRNGLSTNSESIDILVEKIDNRLNLEHNLTKLRSRPWIKSMPPDYSKVHIQNWFHLLKNTIKAKITFNGLRNFREYFPVSMLEFNELKDKLEQLYLELEELKTKEKAWNKYFSENEIQQLFDFPEKTKDYKKVLNKDFDALCEYDRINDSFLNFEKDVIKKLDDAGYLHPDKVEEAFLNSLKLSWIEHIEIKYPVLRAVSSMKLKQLENDLQEAIYEKLRMSKEILLLKVKERTYENVEFNRLNNRTTYRDLYHQVSKKRRLWPLRKLISSFSEELFDLLPCWMASPEAVSALFPMEQFFDLVIFDEASQAFVEKGIPAIYRGKQVMIAGDHQQLRPNDIYQIKWEDEENDSPELEIDSLLELGSRFLPSVQLKGHYRSESLSLIEFSNRHFYDRQLRLLPAKAKVNDPEPAIQYRHIEGVWEKNTNKPEAQEITNLVIDLLKKHHNSIGVVTFNAAQQDLISELLEISAIEEGFILPDSVFVKNIENVQGDEKDIIIFSIGYAPDINGRMMMQFGSLNQVNGENRLNVAVTRARKKIIIVSSILPHQLKAENTANEGPKLLKAYLEYAWKVSEGNFSPDPLPTVQHSKNWYLKNHLIRLSDNLSKDFQLIDELPFAELTIKKDDLYMGLILTDDNLYYQALTVKDLHAYTPFILQEKKWPFRSVFSREYWQQPEEVQHNLQQFLNNHVEV
jgi:superfamily I DNA and/or RNA helicase/KaiC/GvpD/RAD55 family RecA-like ATPase